MACGLLQLAELRVHGQRERDFDGRGYTFLSLVWACMIRKVVTDNTLIIAFGHNRSYISERLISSKDSGCGETAQWGAIKE